MLRAVPFLFAILISLLAIGCGSTPASNANAARNSNVATNVSAKDLPPEMSTSPVPPSANSTPGIPPANAVMNVPKGSTPTPGINPKTAVRTMKPGEKIPGIPDAATMKKQLSQPVDPSKLPPEMRNQMKSNANAPSMTKKPQE
jgi:hypothetical protein